MVGQGPEEGLTKMLMPEPDLEQTGGRKDHMEDEQGGDKPGEWNKDY